MYSFFLLLSIWLFLSLLLTRSSRSDSDPSRVPVAFVFACILLFNLGYLLISLLHVPRQMSHLLMLSGTIFIAASFALQAQRRKTLQSHFNEFFFPSGTLLSDSTNRIETLLRRFRIAIVVLAMISMLVTQVLTPTVHNWDSNWYNLSRIPAMIASRSVFPESTPVLWQILHPLTHDFLYAFDILSLNLRGMGLIASLEFFMILGCLYQITLFLFAGFPKARQGVRVQIALLLVTVLLFSSDLQVLQSADPKNDLVVVMCFIIALMLTLNRSLKQREPMAYFLMLMMVFAYSISVKSYGVIVLIPPLVSLFIERKHGWKSRNISRLKKAIAADFSRLLKQERIIIGLAVLNVTLLLAAYIQHAHSIEHSIHAAEFNKMVLAHTNRTGSIHDRLTIFGLNIIRNAVAFIAYPYTTLLKLNAVQSNDYLLGFGPLTPILNDPRGMLNAAPIVRTINADSAYSSIFMLPLLIVCGFLYCLNRGLRWPSSFRADSVVLMLSCALSFVTLAYVIFSQSWSSKFMGTTYVPLIPLLAIVVVQCSSLSRGISALTVALMSIYTIIRLMFLLDIAMIPSSMVNFFRQPDAPAVTQSRNFFYYQYAGSRSTPEEANRWLLSLANLPSGKVHVFCYGANTPSLTPLMYGIQSFNKDKNLDLRLAGHDECSSSEYKDLNGKMNLIHLF